MNQAALKAAAANRSAMPIISAALTRLPVAIIVSILTLLTATAETCAAPAPRPFDANALGHFIIWPVGPALVLFALPRLVALQSGRYFEFVMLARAMPELVILLTVSATLGLLAVLVCLLQLTGL